MALEIREMELKDMMGVISLIKRELFCNDVSSDIYERLMRIYEDPDYTTFVADMDGHLIGFVGVVRGLAFERDGEFLRVVAMAVRREFQSKGVGTQLVGHVEDYALSRSAAGIVLTSGLRRADVHAFYGRMGYEKSGYSLVKMLPTEKKTNYNDLFAPIPHRESPEDEE